MDLAADGSRTCAVLASGAVSCWGGEQGVSASAPHRLPGVTDAVQVALETDRLCILHRAGTITCNDAPVAGVSDAVQLAIHADALCARRRGGEVACAVASSDGLPALERVHGVAGATALVMGTRTGPEWQFPLVSYGCALVARGATRCWEMYRQAELDPSDPRTPGDEYLAKRGAKPAMRIRAAAATALPAGAELVAPRADDDRVCVRAGSGAAYTCGATELRAGEAPEVVADSAAYTAWDGTCIARGSAVTCQPSFQAASTVALPGVTKLVGAYDHACAIVAGGRVVCWGSDEHAGLGVPHVPQPALADVLGLSDAVDLAPWRAGAVAVRANGQLVYWGHGPDGDVDRPTTFSSLTDVTAVAGGDAHACALRRGGRVSCWGGGGASHMPDWLYGSEPIELPGVAGVRALRLTEGGVMLTLADGTLAHLGDEWVGQEHAGKAPHPLAEAPHAVEAVFANRWLCTRDATPGPVTCRCATRDWTAAPIVLDVPDVVELAAAGEHEETSAPRSLTEGDPDLRYPRAYLALRRVSGDVVSIALTIEDGVAHASAVPFAAFRARRVLAIGLALCAVGDDQIACHSDDGDRFAPRVFPRELLGARALALGNPTCALRADGHVACLAAGDPITAGRGTGRSVAPVPVDM